jgi:hypothetical protein
VTEKNGRILFDRPKPTVGCSASGRRRSMNALGLILTANGIYRLLLIMQTESALCEVRVECVYYTSDE